MKSKNHLYRHPFKPERRTELHLENLQGMQWGAQQVCHVLGLQILVRCGRLRVILDTCPVDSKHTTSPDVPDAFPLLVKSNHLLCEVGDHKITIPQMFQLFVPDPKDIPKKVAEMKVGEPQLTRYCVFETGEENTGELQRAVGTNPHDTLSELFVPENQPVRGVVIEAPSIEIARQIAGQETSRKKMNFCPAVPLRRDGTLLDVGWHGAWLTQAEKLLLAEQKRRDIQDGSKEREQATRIFEAQQVLRRAGV